MPNYGPFQTPYFAPAGNDITAITNANPASVTTFTPHGYFNGAVVRLYIPYNFGMQQINFMKGIITVTGVSTFNIAIDTTLMDAFVVPPMEPLGPIPPPRKYTTPAQCINVGEIASTLQSAFINTLTPLF